MSADAPLSYFYSRAANPLRRCAPAPPKGELFEMVGEFLIAPYPLVTGLTVCALSVTCGDSSPKGRAKNTAESFSLHLKL